MRNEDMLNRMALAIYCASSPFSLVTIYDAMKMAEAAFDAYQAGEANEKVKLELERERDGRVNSKSKNISGAPGSDFADHPGGSESGEGHA